MESETRVDDLVDRWEVMRDHGAPLTIEELCADCPELVAPVRRRIEILREMNSALATDVREPPAAPEDGGCGGAGPWPAQPEVLHATAVYRPRRHHDHGGLGVVYTAHQEELDRTVALKRIRPDKLHDVARRRFLREAALTAGLQHPGIVPIYGLGQDDDGPFYTMPLIQGQTLQTAIDAFHGDESLGRDPGRRSLRFRGLLQQFITASSTVAYAHDQGVVHRDLKPSNIMLGRYGETLVMDWGLAKRFGVADAASDDAEAPPGPSPSSDQVTATGEVLGTPRYMSPEQAKGEPVSLAGDIFSLGLVLYAILTGKSAFGESSFGGADRLKAVREAAIVPPRRRDARLPRALEAICLKAIAAQPADRYPSARALADDVTQWLADEPVVAWRESWASRARRWMRRHRTAVATTVAILVLSLAGLAGFAAVLAAKNRELGQQQQRAEEREALAIDAVKKFRDAVQSNSELKRRPELDGLRKELLKEPMEFFRKLRDQLQSDRDTRPESMAKLARANLDLASTTSSIGSATDAIQSYGESIAILERLARDYPSFVQYQNDLAKSHRTIGALLQDTGHPAEAMESYRRALKIGERLVGDHPAVPDYQNDLASTSNNIGRLLSGIGPPDQALGSFQHALAIQESLVRNYPGVIQYQTDLARAQNNIGALLISTGHLTEALESYRRAMEIHERLVRDNPSVTEYRRILGGIYNNRGELQSDMGHQTEAMQSYRKALAIREQLALSDPSVTQYQNDLAGSHNDIGVVLYETDHLTDALQSYREALAIRERLARNNPAVTARQSDLAASYLNIGNVLKHTGRLAESLQSYHKALEIFERLARENPSDHQYQSSLGAALQNIADVEILQEQWREAQEHLERAIERQQRALAAMPRMPFYQQVLKFHLLSLVKVHQALNQPAEAIRLTRELAALPRGTPSDSYDVACALALIVPIAPAELRQTLSAEAVQTLKQAIAAGWSDAGKTSRDPDLASLHARDDFRRLLAELFDRGFPANPFAR